MPLRKNGYGQYLLNLVDNIWNLLKPELKI
jgi:hypothetical protein